MQKNCENCGAEIEENSSFCPSCGKKIQNKNECPVCGKNIENSENFCENCGADINNPQIPKKTSFIEKNKIPIFIISIAAIIVLVSLIALSVPHHEDTSYYYADFGTQTVSVGSHYFTIPASYHLIPSSIDYSAEGSVMSYMHTYTNGQENISIGVMKALSAYDIDEDDIARQGGGSPKTMFGYNGYYTESVGFYAFTFALGNSVCIIAVSSPYVFDKVEVIG